MAKSAEIRRLVQFVYGKARAEEVTQRLLKRIESRTDAISAPPTDQRRGEAPSR